MDQIFSGVRVCVKGSVYKILESRVLEVYWTETALHSELFVVSKGVSRN